MDQPIKDESSVLWSSKAFLPITCTTLLVLACSAHQGQKQSDAYSAPQSSSESSPNRDSAAALEAKLPLRTLTDVPLTGGATRLDYQSLDSENGRLYIAHLGSDLMTVFDVNKQTIVGDVKDLKRVHGVLAVPELHRVYASATGTNELAVIDDQSLQIVARVPAGDYPDGIAYASKVNKIYVSDLHGKTDTVSVSADPDVLAFDSGLHRLYVSAESGNITIFDEHDRELKEFFRGFFAANAHTVAVDSRTHRVYWPLQNVGGKPVLRIALP